MNTTPASLLERLRGGADPDAWARLVRLYTSLLFYWARRQHLQGADAEDLVQDVLLVLYRKLPEFRYDPRQSFRGWLRTVLLNKWREKHRRARPEPHQVHAALDDLARPEEPDGLEETEYRGHVVGRALQLMRAEFPETTWKAFWEVTAAGRPVAEVAAELGITPNAVYVAKFRVLQRLRAELKGLLE
jgi:RNA polymerase sigma-70 factor (ECF subfamily)